MKTKAIVLEVECLTWAHRREADPVVWHGVIYTSSLQYQTGCDQLLPLKGTVLRSGRDVSRQLCQTCLRSLAEKVRLQARRAQDA